MSEWLAILKQSLDAEWEDRPIVAALATVDANSNPHVRHVICRRIDDQGKITITSDSRSAKNQHIQVNPRVELCLWLPRQRQQFRIAGVISVDSHRDEIWGDLSDSSRATFFWPTPGAPLVDQQFAEVIPARVKPPENFEVLLLAPQQIEHLDLNPHPHRRRRWRRDRNWQLENVNP